MKKNISISKRIFIIMIIVIIILFSTTIITSTVLIVKSNDTQTEKQKNDNSNLDDEEVIKYLQDKNYEFDKVVYSSSDSTIYISLNSNDSKIWVQKMINPYIGTLYTFNNSEVNDEHADITDISENDENEKKQYFAYHDWLNEVNLSNEQIISAIDYYDLNNIAEYIDMDDILS